jgi:hypothetical protein
MGKYPTNFDVTPPYTLHLYWLCVRLRALFAVRIAVKIDNGSSVESSSAVILYMAG